MIPGVNVKGEPDMVGGGVVIGPATQVLGPLDSAGFDGVNSGAVGAMGGPAGILDPNMSGVGGPFSSPAGPDYTNMATSMPMDSPNILAGPQPPNFTDNTVSFSSHLNWFWGMYINIYQVVLLSELNSQFIL